MNRMKKPELLAPAGNFEKLKYAFHYGADAVYLAGNRYGLRAKADNFTLDEIKEAKDYATVRGKKIYVTLNIIAHNEDFEGLADYIRNLSEIGIDGVIVADPGVFSLVRETAPAMKITVSTQANNTNYHTANFWHNQGARRIVLARELSFLEIVEIISKTPEAMEIETFVHGAMCISYSGRCLLSHYLTERDGNRGDCAQPCRWQYHLVENTRPGDIFTLDEDSRGSYIFNSKDLCLVHEIPDLIKAGVSSFKIEGRMKSLYYVATVVSVYRRVIDAVMENPDETVPDEALTELTKVSHRNYTTGFYYGATTHESQNYGTSSYTRHYSFAGVVLDYDAETRLATIEQRGKITRGDAIEVMTANGEETHFSQPVVELESMEGKPLDATPHPKMVYRMKMTKPVSPMDIIRKAE